MILLFHIYKIYDWHACQKYFMDDFFFKKRKDTKKRKIINKRKITKLLKKVKKVKRKKKVTYE